MFNITTAKAGDAVVEGAAQQVGPFIKALFAGSGADARKHAEA